MGRPYTAFLEPLGRSRSREPHGRPWPARLEHRLHLEIFGPAVMLNETAAGGGRQLTI